MTPIQKVILILGSQTKLAKKIGVSPQSVHQWVEQGKPPGNRVLEIESLVNKEVSRYELRPDFYPPASDPNYKEVG